MDMASWPLRPIDPVVELDCQECRWKGGTLWWTLNPPTHTLTRTHTHHQYDQPRAYPPNQHLVLTIINWFNSGLFPIRYHHSKLINTGTLSQNTSSNSVSTCKSVRGECACDHWDGKEAVAWQLRRGDSQRRDPWADPEPWGTRRFDSLCCEACWAPT